MLTREFTGSYKIFVFQQALGPSATVHVVCPQNGATGSRHRCTISKATRLHRELGHYGDINRRFRK